MTKTKWQEQTKKDSDISILSDSWHDAWNNLCHPMADDTHEDTEQDKLRDEPHESFSFLTPSFHYGIPNMVPSDDESDTSSDSWQDALSQLCGPVSVEKENQQDDEQIKQQKQADPQEVSAWQDAVNLLCRAMVIDEDLEEEETLERIYWETRCAPAYCACGDLEDAIDTIVDVSDNDGISSVGT